MDLKVDLLDSFLGTEGFKEEKLLMLTLGARPGLRVSAGDQVSNADTVIDKPLDSPSAASASRIRR